MLTLGGHRPVRIRVGCAGVYHVARRARRGLVPSHLPLRRRLLLEAKRAGRSPAAGLNDSDDESAEASQARGPLPPDGADDLQFWEAQLSQLSFRELQLELRDRGLSAGGRKDELVTRLAEARLQESMMASDGSEENPDQQQEEQQLLQDEEDVELDEGELLDAVLDRLEEMPYNDLRRMCAQRGLDVSGKKPDLQERLAQDLLQSGEDLEPLLGIRNVATELPGEEEEQEEEEEVPGSSPSALPGLSDDPASLLPELLPLKVSELAALLRDYGAPTRGNKQELAMRLAECMVAEVKKEIGAGRGGTVPSRQYDDEDEQEEYDEGEAEEEEDVVQFDPAAISPSDRKLLLAEISGPLYRQNVNMTRQKLFNTLKQLQRNPSYQSKPVLLDQLVRFQAEEKLEEEIRDAQLDPAAARRLLDRLEALRSQPPGSSTQAMEGESGDTGAGSPPPPSTIDYDQIAPVDVRRMRVEDLRDALRHFGMDSSGNKYDMQERLLVYVTMHGKSRGRGRPPGPGAAAGAAGGGAALSTRDAERAERAASARLEVVLGMSVRTLREELDKLGLPTSGDRLELQSRYLAALRKTGTQAASDAGAAGAKDGADVAAAEAAGLPPLVSEAEAEARRLVALAELPVEQRAAAVVSALMGEPQRLITLGMEAPVDVAVVAGSTPGRLDLAQRSLESARALLDHLYTAHMPSPMDQMVRPQRPEAAEEEAAEGEAAANTQEAGRDRRKTGKSGPKAAVEIVEEEDQPELDATLSYAPTAGGVARPPQGVVVSVWWLDGATGQSTLLSPAQVYAATAAELAAGCLPAVHRELLAVPPPSPLSLDVPVLDGPVQPTAAAAASASGGSGGGGGGPVFFPDVSSLAAHLRGAAHVVFPSVPVGSELYGSLQGALQAAGVPHVGTGAEAAALAHDRLECVWGRASAVLRRLESLSYPVVPQLEVGVADVVVAVREAAAQPQPPPAAEQGGDDDDDEEEEGEDPEDEAAALVVAAAAAVVRDKVLAWCTEQGFDPERQLFLVRPRHSLSSPSAADADTALGVERVVELLSAPLTESVLEASSSTSSSTSSRYRESLALEAASTVVLEPAPASTSARFICTVVETPDGPVALLPSEIELYDTEIEILKHNADMAEWAALREGADDDQVAAARSDSLAIEPESWRAVFDPRVTMPAISSVRLHTPPRFSRKLTHAVRHAAARLFGELGLRDVATVEGWVDLPARYADTVEETMGGKGEEVDDVPTLYDPDPFILARIAEQELERIAADPAPLEEYYDYGSSWHANLSVFNPAIRLNGATNGEGATVRFAGVAVDLPLDGRHPAVLQAAEVGLPHAALLRNLANNALRRAAVAGDRRALVPSEPYRSPEEAQEAAAVEAILEAASAEVPPAAEEWAGPVEEVEEAEDGAEGAAMLKEVEEAEERAEEEEDRVGLAAAAAAAAAAEPLEVGPEPLQLPMPPQLPLYHTAVLQHLREADEYDMWIEEMDPDHWEDADGPARVQMMADAVEEQMEEATGLPRGVRGGRGVGGVGELVLSYRRYGNDPNPVAADMVSAVALDGHRMALDAAVDALGDFGDTLSEIMSSMPLDEALEADAEIPLTRVKELPYPDERLPDGIDGTAADPRVVAAWQMAAICELARRHGWEAVEAVDAEEEEAEAAAARAAAGVPEPTPEEEEAAAAAAAEEQTVLEAMCDNDDEVMELRTGLITPVQLYLRFRERQARRAPTSHPLALAGGVASASASSAPSSYSAGAEGEFEFEEGEELEGEAADEDEYEGEDEEQLGEDEEGEEGEDEDEVVEAAGEVQVFLPQPEDAVAPEPGSEAAAAAAAAASFGSASSGPGLEGPTAYTWNLPPDDAVELPVFASAGLTAAAMAVQAAVDGEEGSLARQVAASAREKLDGEELEALAMMELGFEATPVDRDSETGLPVIAAIGPSMDGLNQELILDPFGGGLAELPTFRPLAAVLSADRIEPATSPSSTATADGLDDDEQSGGRVGFVDWEDEDGFAHGVARAAAAASSTATVRRVPASTADDDVAGGEDDDYNADDADVADVDADVADEEEEEDEEEEITDHGQYHHPTVPLVAEALATGDLAGAELAALVPPMNPTRVWVVVGGDGHWGREAGLLAGANVISKLSKYQDLVVEPFLLVPLGEGRDTEARRAELLRRRTEFIAGLGMDPEEDLPPSMSVDLLRVTPPMETGRPETQCIYAVTLATISRPSVPEALSSLERTAAREGVALHALSEMQRQQRAVHCDVQAELAAAGLEGVASMWDDNVLGQPGPPPARPLDLDTFAEDARREGAVVLVAGRGEMAECGHLQVLLELNGVPCVGPGSQQMSWLWDRTEAAEMLQDLHAQGVDTPPRFLLPYEDAATAAELDEQHAEELMDRLRSEVVEDPPEGVSLLVRPASDVAGTGVARLRCGADIVTYMTALRDGDASIPADTLSYPHGEIRLPPRPPPVLSFELFVETDPLFMVLAAPEAATAAAGAAGAAGGAVAAGLHSRREKGWVEVSFTLMGPLGAMSCLPPAMRAALVSEADLAEASEVDEQAATDLAAARNAAAEAAAAVEAAVAGRAGPDEGEGGENEEDEGMEEDEEVAALTEAAVAAAQAVAQLPPPGAASGELLAHAPSTWLAPPPEEALTAAALDAACKRAALIADRLGLQGFVQIEAFVASDSGELAVYDINGSPDLGPDSPIWRQAAAAGLLPQDFLRELLGLAIQASTSPEGVRATYEAQLEAVEREGWDLDEDETYNSQYGVDDEEGELRARGDDEDDEDVESEGGRGGLGDEGDGEEYDMLGQLEEMRAGAGAEEEEEGGDGCLAREDGKRLGWLGP
ncbi:hypothetical protein VOLCADRAFT_108127 [Volvox carteri f. nagariensis]|uniref:SAP domain-containing protein n=1 Tax=Volvox carteri f. nagariensis TaxID=3068 RepID=D8UIE8_VOLCA|nr:uncharacterized protein VOLCADRAFT_108127 [Volvox carteri f. nagariensis]EFJ40498.1 hypothetical protein VOLCADRAFT_108127 [Volvox carteri f. nagariensis]|eukprot:XP_002958422.1 hypothetical protein VOLCADRAFT_108127 [Volvox carteri f. nagariensis]